MSTSTNIGTSTRDDVGKVAWVSGFLSGTVRSVRNYTRFELLEKMVEVLDVIGWMPGFKQEIPSDKYPSKAEVLEIRKRIAAEEEEMEAA